MGLPEEVSNVYVHEGAVIADKYRVEHLLGVGGMAFVVAARHVELDEKFALKFLSREFLGQPSIIERFTREAKAACKLRTEHVARVHDVGVHEGAPFLVMEYLDGSDLATIIHERGALPVEDAVEYTMQACAALAVAHAHGIVHRDIKPENLFLVDHGGVPSIKLLDFGISKIALTGGTPSSRLTGQLSLGTPCYMSPEQIRSAASVDASSDLWSLGAVLYELLAGMEAFKADTVTEVCALVLEGQPISLAELRPDVPQTLADVVTRCLSKDAGARFANMGELAMALLPFAPARAVVSAERSSSMMRSARTMQSGEHRIAQPARFSRAASAVSSSAPVSIEPQVRDLTTAPRQRSPLTYVAVGGVAIAITAAVVSFFGARLGAHSEAGTIAAAPPPAAVAVPIPTTAVTATAMAITPQATVRSETTAAVTTPPTAIAPKWGWAPKVPFARPSPRASATASAVTPAETASAATGAAGVDLGY